MAVESASSKAKAWVLFDYIVADAAPGGVHSNPWVVDAANRPLFSPDYQTLERLLGVPLHLKATTTSGVPALALDVWLSYELRRAGFATDRVWPRPTHPRILPAAAANLINSLPGPLRKQIADRVEKKAAIKGVTASSANILGKNYLKQVDVIMTDWVTGPELLISTKRMDSSYGKNAPNRVEESYGDAKNLRLRHPLAALGFAFGLRSDILSKEPKTAEWLFDLLAKLGQEDDAYHATCLVMMSYADAEAVADTPVDEPVGILKPGVEDEADEEIVVPEISEASVEAIIASLPDVTVLIEQTPAILSPARFLTMIVTRVLNATPVNMHEEARHRRSLAVETMA